jgi:hypothetical protein
MAWVSLRYWLRIRFAPFDMPSENRTGPHCFRTSSAPGRSIPGQVLRVSQADPLQRDASVAHSPSRLCSYRVAFSDNPGRVVISSLVPNRYFMAPRANNSDYGARTGAAPAFNDLYVTIRVVADHQRHCPVTRLHGLFRLRRGSTSRKNDKKGQNGGPGVPCHVHKSSLEHANGIGCYYPRRNEFSSCRPKHMYLKSKIPQGLARLFTDCGPGPVAASCSTRCARSPAW